LFVSLGEQIFVSISKAKDNFVNRKKIKICNLIELLVFFSIFLEEIRYTTTCTIKIIIIIMYQLSKVAKVVIVQIQTQKEKKIAGFTEK